MYYSVILRERLVKCFVVQETLNRFVVSKYLAMFMHTLFKKEIHNGIII